MVRKPKDDDVQMLTDDAEEIFKPDPSLLPLPATSVQTEENEAEAVIVFIFRKPDPRRPMPPEDTEAGKAARKPLKFKTFKTHSFEKIYDMLKSYLTKEGVTGDVVLRYKGIKVYSSSSPQVLRLKDGDKIGETDCPLLPGAILTPPYPRRAVNS